MFFIEFEPLCRKSWKFLSNFGSFYDARLLNMVMSRDQDANFENFFTLS